MSLLSGGLFLVFASTRNRARRLRRKLRQPKYVLAMAAVAVYFYLLILRRFQALPPPATTNIEWLEALELPLIVGAVMLILSTWIFGRDMATLSFSEAEIQILFPAPVSRRGLIHYKLLRNLSRALFSAILSTLLFGRSLTVHPVLFTLGFWLCLSTLMLHATAAAFTRQSLAEHGITALRRNAFILLVAAGVGWMVVRTAGADFEPPETGDLQSWLDFAFDVVHTAPLSYVLWPIRVMTGLLVASDASTFALRLPAALVVFLAHYAWAASSQVSFEEASVEAAELRARLREKRGTRGQKPSGKAQSVTLRASGPPEWALAWKNVLSVKRSLGLRLLPIGLVVVISTVVVLRAGAGNVGAPLGGVLAGMSFMLALFATFAGPTWTRFDFRADLKNLDALKSLPLSGRQMAVGELIGPAFLLGGVQWLLLAAGLALSWNAPGLPGDTGQRLALMVAVGLVSPAISAIGLVLQNTLALAYPDWSLATTGPQRGIEVFGQRLITLVGGLVVLTLCVFPAAIAAFIAGFLTGPWAPVSFLAAGMAASAVLAVELYFAVTWLGFLYDRFDVSQAA